MEVSRIKYLRSIVLVNGCMEPKLKHRIGEGEKIMILLGGSWRNKDIPIDVNMEMMEIIVTVLFRSHS